uniref:Uncharacterized protein n=1 Tax=Aegilops tauschii subsp. strangulata TaxID=200361 RepID=A0A453N0B6_AEGTS
FYKSYVDTLLIMMIFLFLFCLKKLVRDKFSSLTLCWWVLVFFQWSRFGSALQRLVSPTGMLYNKNFNQPEHIKVKAT